MRNLHGSELDASGKDIAQGENEASIKLAASQFEDALCSGEADINRFEGYLQKLKEWDNMCGLKKSQFEQSIREDGRKMTNAFIDRVTPVGLHLTTKGKPSDPHDAAVKDPKVRPGRYSAAIQDYIDAFRAGTTIKADQVFRIHVVDAITFAGIDMVHFGDSVAAVAAMCGSGVGATNDCIFAVLPATLPGQGTKGLKDRRVLEDELLNNGMDIGAAGSLIFATPDHESDTRTLQHWAVLAMADFKKNQYSKSVFAQGKMSGN